MDGVGTSGQQLNTGIGRQGVDARFVTTGNGYERVGNSGDQLNASIGRQGNFLVDSIFCSLHLNSYS